MKKILFIFGTRPEAIKLAPLIKIFKAHKPLFRTIICVTAQHRGLLDQVLSFFEIAPDYDLDLMRYDQTLFDSTSRGISKIEKVLDAVRPDIVFIQGDTTTVLVSALAAFYKRIKIAHIEAGLRTFDKFSPFPEEMNRRLTSILTDYHFAPTITARRNLEKENIRRNIWVVGNTVVDALLLSLDIIRQRGDSRYRKKFHFIGDKERCVLVTAHRRENFGEPFSNICAAIKDISRMHKDVKIIYPVHRNPNIRKPVRRLLSRIRNIRLIEPVAYDELVWLMSRSYIILTDSGGIQEEAPSMRKPVLVLREITERPEGVKAGLAKVVGTARTKIVTEASRLLTDERHYKSMTGGVNPYGDGRSSKRIFSIVKRGFV